MSRADEPIARVHVHYALLPKDPKLAASVLAEGGRDLVRGILVVPMARATEVAVELHGGPRVWQGKRVSETVSE